MTIKNYMMLFSVIAITLSLTGCAGFSAKEKRKIKQLMLDHLVQKYDKEFFVEIVGNLHSASLGNPFGGKISGLKAEAYPIGEENKRFAVHYHKKDGNIDDGYSKLFMTERAKRILAETLKALYNEELKYHISTFAEPFDILPSNEYTLETELSEYRKSFNIEVHVNQVLQPEQYKKTAETIDAIQKELIRQGMKHFHISFVYLNSYDFDHIDHIHAVLDKYYGSNSGITDIYSYCRAKEDCKITASIVKDGVPGENVEAIAEGFTKHRDIDDFALNMLNHRLNEIQLRVLYDGRMHIDSAVANGYTILEDFIIEKKLKDHGKSKIYNGYQLVDGLKRHRVFITDREGRFLFDNYLDPQALELVKMKDAGVHSISNKLTAFAVIADYLDQEQRVVTKASVYFIYKNELEWSNELNEEINRLGFSSLKDIFSFADQHKDRYYDKIRIK